MMQLKRIQHDAGWIYLSPLILKKAKHYYLNQISIQSYQIDARVYELYGLTEEEIRIVNGV